MKVLNVNQNNIVKIIIEFLEKEKIFVVPTDTSYGITGKIGQKTVSRIFQIKKRPNEKAMPIFVNRKIAKEIAVISKKAKILMKKFWPGVLTLILEARPEKLKFLKPVLGPNNTVAIREPNNRLIQKILKKYDLPITATSANISNKSPAYISEEVVDYFAHQKIQPDYFVDAGSLPQNPVSTIIDITDELKIFRTGKIKEQEIKEALKNK